MTPTEQPLHIHCDEHISRLEAENERLRSALEEIIYQDSFGDDAAESAVQIAKAALATV